MDKLATEVAALLRARSIPYAPHDDYIRIVMPSGFGEIEIGQLPDGDTILGIVDQAWHTHGEMLIPEYGDDIPSAMVGFLEAIFSGDLKMLEFQLLGEERRRVNVDDLESFLKYQQPGEKNRVFDPK